MTKFLLSVYYKQFTYYCITMQNLLTEVMSLYGLTREEAYPLVRDAYILAATCGLMDDELAEFVEERVELAILDAV